MPFIKAKNGNVVELAADLVQEFLDQGHAGPYDTEEEARGGSSRSARSGRGKRAKAAPKDGPATPKGDDDSTEGDDTPAVETTGDREPAPSIERPGRGASQALWAAYADAIGVEYPTGSGRDEIRDAVEGVEEKGGDS